MAKSIFIVRSYLEPGQKSIDEVATLLVSLLSGLSKIDTYFEQPIFEGDFTGSTELNISKHFLAKAKAEISSLILENNKADILEFEQERSPTSEFRRHHGFRILFKFKSPTGSPFSLTGSLGSSSHNYLRLEYFRNDLEQSKDWYKSVLIKFISQLSPLYAAVTPMLPDYVNMFNQLEVTHQLGWFTFFRKDHLAVEIFDSKFKISRMDSGSFIEYLNDNLSDNLENYEQAREELIDQMKQLKETIPAYSQQSDSSLT